MAPGSLRVLVTVHPAMSHLATVAPLAQALASRGHDVRVATAASMIPVISAQGLQPLPAGLEWEASRVEDHFPGFLRARARSQARVLANLGTGLADDVLDVARQWRPDVIVRDSYEFGGMALGALLDKPVVVAGVGLRPPREWLNATYSPIASRLRERYRLGPATESDVTGDLWLSSFPRSTAWESTSLPNEEYVQPVPMQPPPDEPAPLLPDSNPDSVVYVTLGTVFNQHVQLLRLLSTSLARQGLDVIVTTGRSLEPDAIGPMPKNVHVFRYVTQSRLMPHVAAVVSHGGFNTVMGALVEGVPVCCVPLGAEHPLTANRCVELGVGRAITTSAMSWEPPSAAAPTVTPEAVVDAVLPLLTEPQYRRRARALQDEIQSLPDPLEVAALVERLGRARAA